MWGYERCEGYCRWGHSRLKYTSEKQCATTVTGIRYQWCNKQDEFNAIVALFRKINLSWKNKFPLFSSEEDIMVESGEPQSPSRA